MSVAVVAGRVSVEPAEFGHVKFDATEIADVVLSLADLLQVTNSISVLIDETSPLAKITSTLDARSSDATIVIRAQSGALENTKKLTTFGVRQAQTSIGRMLLRSRDRLRADFVDVGGDDDLTLAEHAVWDTYCAGRLARAGVDINEQRWRYNHRNRLGFTDTTDADFDRLWSADDLGWADVVRGISQQ